LHWDYVDILNSEKGCCGKVKCGVEWHAETNENMVMGAQCKGHAINRVSKDW